MVFYTKALNTKLPKRMTLAMLMAANAFAAWADSKLTIADLGEIIAGNEYTIQVMLQNEEEINAMTADLVLPEGMELLKPNDNDYYTWNTDVLTPDFTKAGGYNAGVYKIFVGGTAKSKIEANSNPQILEFTVKTDINMKGDAEIILKNQKLSTTDKQRLTVDEEKVTVNVKDPNEVIPAFSISAEEALTILPKADATTIEVALNNNIPVTGFETRVQLPEGMTIVEDSWKPTDRANGFTVSCNRLGGEDSNLYQLRVFVGSDATFEDNEGTLFSFQVVADNRLAAESKIDIFKVAVTKPDASEVDIDAISIAVSNPNAAAKDAADVELGDLAKALKEAQDGVDPSVRADEKYTEETNDVVLAAEKAAQDAIDAVQDFVDEKFDDVTLWQDEQQAELEKLVKAAEDAIAAVVKAGEDAKALLDQLTKNDEINAALQPQLADLYQAIEDAKKYVADRDADVAADYDDDFQEIVETADVLKNGIKEAYEKPNRNLDDFAKEVAELAIGDLYKAIDKVKEEADAAQEAFWKAEAQGLLTEGTEAAEAAINAIREEVADEVAAEKKDVEDALAALKDAVENGEPYRESIEDIRDLAEALDKAIETLKIKEQEAKDNAEKDALDAANAALEGLKAELKAAEDAAEANDYVNSPEVLDEELAKVEKAAEDAVKAVEDFIAEYGRTDEFEGDLADPKNAEDLETLINDAEAAIDAIGDKVEELTARKQASQEAYERLKPQVDELKAKYDDYVRRITLGDGHVVLEEDEDIIAEKAALDKMFEDLYEQLRKANEEDVSLTAESNIDAELKDINDAIDQFIIDVDDKTKANDHNAQRYAQLNRDLNDLQEELDDAKEAIEALPNVGGLYEDEIQGLQDRLDTMRDELETANTNHELDLATELDDYKPLKKDIAALVKAAQDEEAAYNQNKADLEDAVEGLKDALEQLQDDRDKLVNDNEFIDDDDVADIDQQIADLDQAIKDIEDALAQADDDKKLTDQDTLDELNKAIEDANKAAEAGEKAVEDQKADYDLHHQTGDVNDDTIVNVADIVTLLNGIFDPATLPVQTEDPEEFARYDVNGDGGINVVDATAIINIINNTVYARSTEEVGAETLEAQTTMQNGMQNVALSLNSARSYVAYQLDVVLPEGTLLDAAELTSRTEGHTLKVIDLGNNTKRVFVYSMNNSVIEGNDGAVLNLRLIGNGQAQIQNVVFGDQSAVAHEFTVAGAQTTGISGVKAETGVKGAIYNMGGRVMNALKKGINIIRRADGTTQKIVK